MTITDIYRIKTANSVYEVHISSLGKARCRKENGFGWHDVRTSDMSFMDKLVIGASFNVPGVVLTSVVSDYNHLVVSAEPKRYAEVQTTMGQFFGEVLVDAIKDQAMGHRPIKVHAGTAVTPTRVYKGYGPGCSEFNHVGGCVCDLPPSCTVEGCTYSSKYGPSHDGSRMCKSGSIASGGTRAHCACDYCY